jgi:subtilisin
VSARIQEELNATGVAQVIVVLKEPGLATPPARAAGVALESRRRRTAAPSAATVESLADDMKRYFVASPHSQDASLARAVTFEVARRSGGRGMGRARVGALTFESSTRRAGGRASLAELMAREGAPAVPTMHTYPNLGIMLGTVDAQSYADLKKDARVASVTAAPEISLIRPTTMAAATPKKEVSWGLKRLGIPELWDAGLTGKGILVGHLDTGADGTHPALKGAIKHFAHFDLLGNETQVAGAKAWDTGTHGTHTAGTIAGRPIGNTSFGVAPGADLASAIVIEGGNVIARILGGMNWAVGKRVRILSMSLGLRGYRADFLPVTQVLRARNVLPVFAVGNEGPGTSRSPGNYVECLSVGASGSDDAVAGFSSSQSFVRVITPVVPDIVAPGVDVISCVPGNQYARMSGTSMATPHVAGLAALLFQADNSATADDVEKAIFQSCEVPPGMFPERGGLGIPHGPRACEILTGAPLGGATSVAVVRERKTKKKPPTRKAARGRRRPARSR